MQDLDTAHNQAFNAVLSGLPFNFNEWKSKFEMNDKTAKKLLSEMLQKGYLLQDGLKLKINDIEPNILKSHHVCTGVGFRLENSGNLIKSFFPNPAATLPVVSNGKVELIPWGKRMNENSRLPSGGWARLDAIKAGIWGSYNPDLHLVAANCYMEKSADGKSHWFDLAEGFYLQCVVVPDGSNRRAYLITVSSPSQYEKINGRWPRLIAV